MEPATPAALGKKSVIWAGAETGGTTLLSMATMLLMARMMGPDDFGTAALVIGGVQFLNLFVEGLFHDGLIQNPDTDDAKFEAAFSLVQIIAVGILIVSLIVAVSMQGSGWSRTSWLFVGAACSLPFTGALGIGNARFRRDLVYREIAHASLIGRLVGSLLGLGLAMLGFGAWSLIGQYTGIAMLQAGLLYRASGWRPRPRTAFGLLWPTCRFALPYALMHSLVSLRLQAFLMMIAGFMDLTAAGYVNVAFRLTTTPQVVLTTAFTNLGLPLLARHQTSPQGLEQSFRTLNRMVMSSMIPAFIGLALTARELVPFLLGSEWVTATPLVQVLAVGAAISFMRLPASTVLRALGHVRYSFASSSFQLAFTLIGMWVLRPQDLQTTILLWVLPAVLQLPVTFLAAARASTIRLRVLCASLVPTLAATAAMSVVVVAVDQALQADAAIYRLIGKASCGAAVAIVVLVATDGRLRSMLASAFRRARA